MSRITVALGSFILGACSMALLGSHTSTVAQAPSTPPVMPPETTPGRPCQFTGLSTEGGRRAVVIGGVEPVASVTFGPKFCATSFKGSTTGTLLALDGLDCDDCTFDNVALEYSGGAWNLNRAHFIGVTHISLKGAAANTLAFLALAEAIERQQTPPAPKPNVPIIKTATSPTPMTVSLSSPYK